MDVPTLLAFSVVAALTIITPGPAILLSIRNGSVYGVRSVLWSAFGNVCGVFCMSGAAMLGLGVAMKSSAVLFDSLKFLGAGYLFYLGIRSFRSGARSLHVSTGVEMQTSPRLQRLFTEAFLTAATNPKALLFFTALFPQFIHTGKPLLPQFLSLTGIFMALAYLTHLGYAAAASRMKAVLQQPSFAAWLNRLLGATFISFSVMLMTLRRSAE